MATLDSSTDPNHLHVDSLPLIDLRLLSQSELYSMSLRSSSSAAYHLHRRCDDDAIIPKIDRSVFNESAGSRKQTFSRLRLAPRDNQIANASSSITGIPQQNPEPVDEENAQIIGLLQQLFGVQSFRDETNDDGSLFPVRIEFRDPLPESSAIAFQNIPIDVVDGAQRKRKRGRPRKNEIPGVRVDERARKEEDRLAMTMVNNHSVPVDAAALANFEDPFGEEINRRTQGLVTESQLLEFLGTLNGEWVSQRKKRKIVLASDFGGLLPCDWKIMLSLKRRAGRVWIFCRRYISPDGHQFVSCEEVSSYLLSFFGLQDVSQSRSCHTDDNLHMSSKLTSENQNNGCVPKTGMKSDGVASSSHIPCTSICIDLERQATVASSIGSEKQSTSSEIVNDDPASEIKIRNTSSGNVTDFNSRASLLSKDHQTLDGDTNDTNSVLGHLSEGGIDCKLHNEKFVDVNRADDISLVIPISFTNNKSTGSYECSETNGMKCIKDGINNFVSQDVNVACYETVPCVNEQACLVENSGHGPSSRSVEDSRQKIGSEGKKCSGSSMEDGHLITSLEDMKISDKKRFEDERGLIISGNCHSETKNASSRAEVISCSQGSSIVLSQNELECASVNSKNGVLTSMTTDSSGAKCFDSGLSNSSTYERTCAPSNNVNSVSSCIGTQDVSKFGGIDVASDVKATMDFSNNHASQNDYIVTSCAQERSSLNEKSFNIELENPSHGSSEKNLLIPTGNLHPNVFDDQNHGDVNNENKHFLTEKPKSEQVKICKIEDAFFS